MWRRRFGANPEVVGRTVLLEMSNARWYLRGPRRHAPRIRVSGRSSSRHRHLGSLRRPPRPARARSGTRSNYLQVIARLKPDLASRRRRRRWTRWQRNRKGEPGLEQGQPYRRAAPRRPHGGFAYPNLDVDAARRRRNRSPHCRANVADLLLARQARASARSASGPHSERADGGWFGSSCSRA